jgi:hypothetical protein
MYFYYQSSGETLPTEIIKELFAKHKKEWKKIALQRKKDIIAIGKQYREEILHIGKHKDFNSVQADTIRMLKKK